MNKKDFYQIARYVFVHLFALIFSVALFLLLDLLFGIPNAPLIGVSCWTIFAFCFLLVPDEVVDKIFGRFEDWF